MSTSLELTHQKFAGVTTALITPFSETGVDYDALEALIERQIADGVDGILACGSTGEAATLSHEEHTEIFRFVQRTVAGRTAVMAGTGSNNTLEAIALTRAAESAGVDAVLVITPYYNKPSQAGLVAHFAAVAAETALPVYLYDIPGRTGTKIAHETVLAVLDKASNVVGLKDATGSVENTGELHRLCGQRLQLLSGDDGLTLPFLSVGAQGVISVASHLIAPELRALIEHFRAGNNAEALAIHQKWTPLMRALFVESNPCPLKYILAQLGWISSDRTRMPLVAVQPSTRTLLEPFVAELQALRS